MNVVEALTRRRALAWCTALLLAGAGAVVATRLPSGIYPDVEFPRIVVVAKAGDAPSDVTQVTLARPLETELATVLGVERIRSRSIRGAVELSLQFAPGTDMWRALQLVESRVGEARASLPAGTDLTVERLTTTSFPVVTFNVSGPLDPRRLREAADLVLRPAISRVRGVGRVEVLGGDVREIEVVLDPERTAALRLTPTMVAERLRAQSVLQAVGRYDEAHGLVTVLAAGEARDVAELARTTVAVGADGGALPLSAIADVTEGAEDRLQRVSGPDGETVLVSVSRLPGASTPDVVARVLAALDLVRPTLPPEIRVVPVYDQAVLVDASMRSLRDAILLGILLAVAVIALFLRDVRAGLSAAVAVPITLAATFVPMRLFGLTLNLMSLGGLAVAIGLVVDDAIVVVEAIGRRLEEGASPAVAAREGTGRMLSALVGTTLTTVVVFLPLAFVEGVVGSFFASLAATLAAAVLLSLLAAVTVVPLAAEVLVRPRPARPPRLGPAYARLLRPLLRRPALGVLAAIALLGAGVLAMRAVGTGFLPEMDEGAFVLDYFLPSGTSLDDTDAVARKIERILVSVPEVESYSRRTGAELGPAAATEVSRGDMMVRLRPRRARGVEEVVSEVRARVAREVPEARVEFVQVLQDVLNDLAGTPRPIEVKVFGADPAVLRTIAADVAARIADVPGLVDLYSGVEPQTPELRVRLDSAAAARLGTSAADLEASLDAALHGTVAATMRRPERPLGVRVRYPDAVRFDPTVVSRLPVVPGPGGLLPLAAAATLERGGSPSALLRENLQPVIVVDGDHENRDLGSVVADVRARLSGVKLPPGYRLELGGQFEGQQGTFRDLAGVAAFGLAAVLLVLLVQFRRARLVLLVLASVPLSVVGALGTLVATGLPLNASSLMGCILLVGLVVKNGILLLEEFEAHADSADVRDALVLAGERRVRPILMTTLATMAGLAPLALGLGSGADLQRPLAVAVLGGLAVSTAVSLFVLPALVAFSLPRSPRSQTTGGPADA